MRRKRNLEKILFSLALLAIVIYGCDFAIWRFRIATGRSGYDHVSVRTYLAIQEKGNRVEYVFQGEQQEQCVRALFPQFGAQPCWYLRRHTDRKTVI